MQDYGGIIRRNSGLAVDLGELLLPHGGATSGTGEWNSRFCSVRVKINEYSIVECGYKQHSFAETARIVQTGCEGMLRVDNIDCYRS